MNYTLLHASIFLITSTLLSNQAALDTSFNHTGFTFHTSSWASQEQTCTAIQPDGKILVAGNAIASPATQSQVSIVRFNTNGSLDTTFNTAGPTAGTLTYSIPGFTGIDSKSLTYGIGLQSDGSIIATGTCELYGAAGTWPFLFVIKFQSDGTLDSSFGQGIGIVNNTGSNIATGTQDVYGNPGSILYGQNNTADAYAIAPQVDGKIIIAGQVGNGNPICLRFLSYGALDTTTNGGSGFGAVPASSAPGYLIIPDAYPNGTNGALVKSISIDTNTNIYMAGQYNPNTNSNPAHFPVIYQCSQAGILNTNYGVFLPNAYAPAYGAVISTNTSFVQGNFNGIRVTPNGKAIAVGTATFNGGTNYYMVIARFTATGQLDTTFGNGLGYVINTLCSTGQGISINADGAYLVTGQLTSNPSYAALLRYTNDGTLDTTFTENGYFAFNSIGYPNTTLGMDTTSDGKIHFGATINNNFGAFQLLSSNELRNLPLPVLEYGFNKQLYKMFLYIDLYAQTIQDLTARSATIAAITTMLNNYETDYAQQPNFNYLVYLYLLSEQIAAIEINLSTAYPESEDQITQFFLYFVDRCDKLSAI